MNKYRLHSVLFTLLSLLILPSFAYGKEEKKRTNILEEQKRRLVEGRKSREQEAIKPTEREKIKPGEKNSLDLIMDKYGIDHKVAIRYPKAASREFREGFTVVKGLKAIVYVAGSWGVIDPTNPERGYNGPFGNGVNSSTDTAHFVMPGEQEGALVILIDKLPSGFVKVLYKESSQGYMICDTPGVYSFCANDDQCPGGRGQGYGDNVGQLTVCIVYLPLNAKNPDKFPKELFPDVFIDKKSTTK